ncbi:hypothetical protein tb265_37810 [Gemmatimonadetes bacterium T265]|nr:hypothetical protein tb265_37810 [Gemmatimonadetes bacterium T265]
MSALAARAVEDACAGGKLEKVDQARDLAPVPRLGEERFVLGEVVRVEVRRPPVGGARGLGRPVQKKTGSRYAPNTSSNAARIS